MRRPSGAFSRLRNLSSMYDLLSKEEDVVAASQGWQLSHVYDLEVNAWRVMVLGMPSAVAASLSVVERARNGSPLALKALRTVMNSSKGL